MAKMTFDELVSFFPMDRCRELVRMSLAELDAQALADDSVILPDLDENDRAQAQADLNNPDICDEAKHEMRVLLSFIGKRPSEVLPLTPELDAERLEYEMYTTANEIIKEWLNVLNNAKYESGDKPVRLDGSLLPPPELSKYDGVSWDERLTNSSELTVEVEQLRELMSLYVANLIPVFDSMIANNPNGFELFDDIIVGKDKDGFYLLPEVKE